MFVMAKKIKELFASTLNRIPASVKCVSSIIVVLNVKFVRLLAVHANKNTAVLTVHTKTSQLYSLQRSMQANTNINLW